MEYRTLMVRLELEHENDAVLRVARELAQQCKATLIGVAACQPLQIFYGDAYISPEVVTEDRAEIETQMKRAEAQFRHAFPNGEALEWRPIIDYRPLSRCIAQQARAADIVVTAPDRGAVAAGSSRRVDVGDLVLRLGRPMMIVPDGERALRLDNAVVGWNDTREARRAIVDALPVLKRMQHVLVVRICGSHEIQDAQMQLPGVAAWLQRHGLTAETRAVAGGTGPDADRLAEVVDEYDAGLVVAGAYGHSRLHEWVLGGVTRNFLLNPARTTLISH